MAVNFLIGDRPLFTHLKNLSIPIISIPRNLNKNDNFPVNHTSIQQCSRERLALRGDRDTALVLDNADLVIIPDVSIVARPKSRNKFSAYLALKLIPSQMKLTEIKTIKSENQLKFLTNFLQKEMGKVLGRSANRFPSKSQGFFDLGMDSLMAIELKSKLETSLQTTISSTVIFEYSNIDRLANYIFADILDIV